MRINTFFYSIRQGLKNIFRNKMFSLASVATMAACIFMFGLFYIIVTNFSATVHSIEEGVSVTVFFEHDATDAQIRDIGEKINKRAEVSKNEYVSADEAWKEYKKVYFQGKEELADGFTDNPLANSAHYQVYLNDVSMQDSLVTYIKGLTGVREVKESAQVANTLTDFNKLLETALQYGYSYETREEKYFILLLIRGAVSYGDTLCEIDGKVNEFIRNGILPEEYQDKEQIEQTAGALSKELLYMKFLQGIPVVGAVGGAYDAVYMKRITEYAELKYRHRYLAGRKKAENGQLCKRCKSYRDI